MSPIGIVLSPLSHEDSEKDITPPSDADKTFTTVLVGDSIIKQIQGRQLGRKVGHRVVVKSFPWRKHQRHEALPNAYF